MRKNKVLLSALVVTMTTTAVAPAFANPLRTPQSEGYILDQKKIDELKREQEALAISAETLATVDEKYGKKNSHFVPGLLTITSLAVGFGSAYAVKELDDKIANVEPSVDFELQKIGERASAKIRELAVPGYTFSEPAYGVMDSFKFIDWSKVTPENRKAVLKYVESLASQLGEEKFAKLVDYARDPNVWQELSRVPDSAVVGRSEQVLAKMESRIAHLEHLKGRLSIVGLIAGFTTFASVLFMASGAEAKEKVANLDELLARGKNDEADKLVEQYQMEYLVHASKVAELTRQLKTAK